MSYYARQIFDETKVSEFRKLTLKHDLLKKDLLYNVTKEWEETLSLYGNLTDNSAKTKDGTKS